ncbi:MAG: hypothetical protein Q8868_01260 [Bacteroidota bacterium]|nr:hypothetical protein [Bacteroidota bacterium]
MLAAAVICQGFAFQASEGQETKNTTTTGSQVNKRLETLESLEGATVTNEKNEAVRVYENDHNRNRYQEWEDEHPDRGARHFRGHWSGFEIGFNNYAYNRSMTLPEDVSYMKVDANSSLNLNLNFSQLSIGFSRHMGIVTGIGLNWNNYRFEHGNSIDIGSDEVIEPVYYNGVTPPVKRSKFGAIYLNVPALLEVQIPAGFDNHLNISAGVVGGLRLNAWTKIVYEDKEKSKVNGDYNLNLLRGGVTARVGYQNFMIYGTYYLTPWFQDNKGPNGLNLEPFEIGLAFTFND